MYDDDDDDDDGDCDGDGVVAILAIHKKKALSFNGFTRWRVAIGVHLTDEPHRKHGRNYQKSVAIIIHTLTINTLIAQIDLS
ncbi:hypothetical protein BLOT_000152 [Blomia tropicalis]|nr:hypothetical protein BLOT_000152 [Blomia tropicalis]